jgi:hypothetical protein
MSFSLFTTTVEQILEDVSMALIETLVDTTLGTAVALSGQSIVSPASMAGIYFGAYLLVDTGVNQEQITVSAVTATTFTAYFALSHSANAPVVGATFPSGQTDHPLFTQNEILGYLADVQNDFLLKTRCIFGVTGTFSEPANLALVAQQRFYAQPPTAIRVERVARIIPGQSQPIMDLYDTTQADLDMENFAWTSESDVPRNWFRDQIDTSQLGLDPMPNVNGSLELWYSKRGPLGNQGAILLTGTLLIPDVMAHLLKYGVLARMWSKDGESRDPLRSEYCKKRYEFGIVLTQRFMEGIGLDTGAPAQKYNPMVVPSGGQ